MDGKKKRGRGFTGRRHTDASKARIIAKLRAKPPRSSEHIAAQRLGHLASPARWAQLERRLATQWANIEAGVERWIARQASRAATATRREHRRLERLRHTRIKRLCRRLRAVLAKRQGRGHSGTPCMQGEVACESIAEAHFVGVMVAEGRQVRRYAGEPLAWRDDQGIRRHWVPDFEVIAAGGQVVVIDVKSGKCADPWMTAADVARLSPWDRCAPLRHEAHPHVRFYSGWATSTVKTYDQAVASDTIPRWRRVPHHVVHAALPQAYRDTLRKAESLHRAS